MPQFPPVRPNTEELYKYATEKKYLYHQSPFVRKE